MSLCCKLADDLRRLPPGRVCTISYTDLCEVETPAGMNAIEALFLHDSNFARTLYAAVHPSTLDVSFYRFERPLPQGCLTFVQPNRRHLYSQNREGIFEWRG